MFRGKESSNRIELSRLVQDLLNFGLLGSLRLWGWGGGGWMGWGVVWGAPTHVHTHAHACMDTHTHVHVLNMIISCKWPPPLGESLGIPYDVICMCACGCMRACACVCTCVGAPSHHPPFPSTQPSTLQGGTPRISQNSIALELIKIFQFSLKIWNLWRLPHSWVGVWFGGLVGGWVGWWVGSGQNTKNLKIVDWIKIIQFCLKIYDL